MKKLLLLFLAFGLFSATYTQVLVENFTYTAVNPASDSLDDVAFKTANPLSSWVAHTTSNIGAAPLFTATGLSYTGYNTGTASSATGAVKLTHGGGTRKDFNAALPKDSTGAYYCFFIINVTQADSTAADYVLHFCELSGSTITTGGALLPGKVYIRKGSAANKFQFAVSKNGVTNISYSADYDLNKPIAVVLKYKFNSAAKDDIASLFVFDGTTIPSVEPAMPTLTAGDNATTNDAKRIAAVGIRQGFGGVFKSGDFTTSATFYLDGIKVSRVWDDLVLPSLLQNFTAVPVNGQVNINWEMKNEQNVQGYVLEKSINGTSFSTLDVLAAKGLINVNKYVLVDKNAGTGTVYYRVKIIYNNSNIVYSNVAKVNLAAAIKVQVSPNPAKNFITVNASAVIKTVEVLNIKGSLILKVLPNAVGANVDVSNLPVGTYIVKTATANGFAVNTIIKQ